MVKMKLDRNKQFKQNWWLTANNKSSDDNTEQIESQPISMSNIPLLTSSICKCEL